VQSGDLSLDMDYEKTSVMGYRTMLEGFCIYHSNSGIQISHEYVYQWLIYSTLLCYAGLGRLVGI
jgi:hypothetical protein